MVKLPPGYQIRPATHGDIPALVLVEQASNELFAPTGLIPAELMEDHISIEWHQEAIEANMSQLVVAPDNTPVGFTLTSLRPPDLYLDEISVHPAHGRKGLGAALLTQVVETARQAGIRSVSLSTFRDVPWNAPFYARHGFKLLSERKWTDWMQELNTIQAETLDVSKRCFMRRTLKRPLLG